MPFYWRSETIPGIEAIPKRERQRFVRRMIRTHLTEMQRLALALPGGAGAAAGCWLASQLSASLSLGQHSMLTALGAGVGGLVGGMLSLHLELRRIMPHLEAELSQTASERRRDA